MTRSYAVRPNTYHMTTQDRIDKINTFMQQQRYLSGRLFRVVPAEDEESFVIELKEVDERSFISLQHTIRLLELNHISATALKIVDAPRPKPKKQHRNRQKPPK